MAKKRHVMTVAVHPAIAERFREVAGQFDDKLGMCISASMLMFLDSPPDRQGDYLRKVFDAQIKGEVRAMLDEGLFALADRTRAALLSAEDASRKNKPKK